MRPLVIQLFTMVSMLWVLVGCGDQLPVALVKQQRPALSWPQPEEVAAGIVQPNSYLVAFKQIDRRRSGLYFATPQARVRHHRRWLGALTSPARAAGRYLASLDLRRPGRSFAPPSAWPQAPALRLNWNEDRLPTQEAHLTQIDFESAAEARLVLTNWYERGLIWYAEPNFRSRMQQQPQPLQNGQLEEQLIQQFDDPDRFPWLNQIDFVEAIQSIDTSQPRETPVVAVLDSGIDVTHPALADRIFENSTGQNKLCLNDLLGCNTTVSKKDMLGNGEAYPAGTGGYGEVCFEKGNCWHGTHVAGIIAADGGDEYTGICPYCRILNVKVVDINDDNGNLSFVIQDSAIIAGLAYVSGFTQAGEPLVRVINTSFGKFQRSRSVELFIRSLTEFGKGVLVVAAAGNEDTMKRQYPAAFDEVIAVSNVLSNDQNPQKSPSSNFGMWVDIAAPGDGRCNPVGELGILSSIPGGSSGCLTGTSMASPVVAGVAGLLLAVEPDLAYNELRARIINSGKLTSLYQDGVNDAYRPTIANQQLIPLLGSGVVNSNFALNPEDQQVPALLDKPNRVSPGCAQVGLTQAQAAGPGVLWLLGVPLLSLFLGRIWSNIRGRLRSK